MTISLLLRKKRLYAPIALLAVVSALSILAPTGVVHTQTRNLLEVASTMMPWSYSGTFSTCTNDPNANIDAQERISYFKETAKSLLPMTDKIGSVATPHRYHNMYGHFLLPFAAHKPDLKFLEIGLGCDMRYGPGASVQVWKKLFPHAELWEAEYDGECVKKAIEKNQLDGIHTLVGDQGDFDVLDSWIETSGGKFDIIIDDGGHHNCHINNSLLKLWPQLNPGGYYFIEDLQVGLHPRFQPASEQCDNVPMSEKVGEWQEHLIYQTMNYPGKEYKYPLPEDLVFIHCQAEACVLHKRGSEVNDPYLFKPKA
jgi:hypothetical protein